VLPAFATAKALTLVVVVLAAEHGTASPTWASLRDAFTHWDAVSYLDIAGLIEVAQRCGADSLYPGYGFLSENADFAQAVIDAGLIWIGPSPQSIRDLGDKVTARFAQFAGRLVPYFEKTKS